MKKFGIRTDGTEQEMEDLVKSYISKVGCFNYAEIGVAGGLTFKAMYDIARENTSDFDLIGLDLVKGYSLDWNILNSFPELSIYTDGKQTKFGAANFNLYLESEPYGFYNKIPNNSIDIAIIDGRHCRCNVIKDFEHIEAKIKTGGLVLFHDFGILESGDDRQCENHFIEVRDCCKIMGLLDGKRPGWKLDREILGSRCRGGDGNTFGVFVKTE